MLLNAALAVEVCEAASWPVLARQALIEIVVASLSAEKLSPTTLLFDLSATLPTDRLPDDPNRMLLNNTWPPASSLSLIAHPLWVTNVLLMILKSRGPAAPSIA